MHHGLHHDAFVVLGSLVGGTCNGQEPLGRCQGGLPLFEDLLDILCDGSLSLGREEIPRGRLHPPDLECRCTHCMRLARAATALGAPLRAMGGRQGEARRGHGAGRRDEMLPERGRRREAVRGATSQPGVRGLHEEPAVVTTGSNRPEGTAHQLQQRSLRKGTAPRRLAQRATWRTPAAKLYARLRRAWHAPGRATGGRLSWLPLLSQRPPGMRAQTRRLRRGCPWADGCG